MSDERTRILEMLAQGKITVADAERLLDAVGKSVPADLAFQQPAKANPRYLRVVVEDGEDNVNVRVPLQLLRAGIQLSSLIPESAKGKINAQLGAKGVNLDLANLKPEMLDDLIGAFSELEVNVDGSDGERVRVFCE